MLLSQSCATSQESIMNKVKEDKLPYASIPEHPEAYTTGAVLGRMIDGLGFRYYWATDGLTKEDLNFDPGGGNRPPIDVLSHLYGLSGTIVNAAAGQPNIRPMTGVPEAFEELRKQTLLNFARASELLKASSDAEVADMKITFKRGERESSTAYWHMMNGPLADAIYHVGQITSYRRSSGNPIDPTVNVFMGTQGH